MEAAAHMNKLQHNLLQEMQGNESSLDDMCHLGNDLGVLVWSILLVELLECGPVDLGNQ